MIKSPIVNAFLASGYIGAVVFIISFFEGSTPEGAGNETLLIPVAMLSLFVLSAATMGYLFLYQPFVLWFENKKQEALNFFLTTLAVFGGITVALLATLFYTL